MTYIIYIGKRNTQHIALVELEERVKGLPQPLTVEVEWPQSQVLWWPQAPGPPSLGPLTRQALDPSESELKPDILDC